MTIVEKKDGKMLLIGIQSYFCARVHKITVHILAGTVTPFRTRLAPVGVCVLGVARFSTRWTNFPAPVIAVQRPRETLHRIWIQYDTYPPEKKA